MVAHLACHSTFSAVERRLGGTGRSARDIVGCRRVLLRFFKLKKKCINLFK